MVEIMQDSGESRIPYAEPLNDNLLANVRLTEDELLI